MKSWRKIARQIDSRPPRERWLIAGTTLAVLMLLIDQFIVQSLFKDREQLKRELGSLESTIQLQTEEISRLQVTLARNPDDAPKRELAQLQKEHAAIDRKIAEASGHLVDPEQMAEVLQAVLERAENLKLIALVNLDPQPLEIMTGEVATETDAFRHGLRIELEGSFNDTLEYLQKLEALPWGFFWDHLEITTGEYPQNRISIEVYTLSIGRQWLGV